MKIVKITLILMLIVLNVRAQQPAYRIHEEGQKLFNEGKYTEAIAKFDATIKADPTYFEAYCDRGRANVILGKTDLAMADFNKTITLNAKYAPGFYNRAKLNQQLKNEAAAIQDYSSAIGLNPALSDAYLNRGILYHLASVGPDQKAMDDFNKVIQLDPKNAEAFYQRALLYRDMNKNAEAITDLTKAYTLEPARTAAYVEQGKIYAIQKKYDLAIADYSKAITLGANTEEVYRARAFAFVQVNKNDDAIHDYSYLIEQLHSTDPDLYRIRGELFLKMNNLPPALKDFNKGLSLKRDDVILLLDRADTYYRMGKTKFASAEVDFKKVLVLDDKNVTAARKLAQLYFDQEKWQMALDNINIAIKVSAVGDDYDLRGKCQYKLNNKKAACEDLTKAETMGCKVAATDKLNAGCK